MCILSEDKQQTLDMESAGDLAVTFYRGFYFTQIVISSIIVVTKCLIEDQIYSYLLSFKNDFTLNMDLMFSEL